MKYAIRIRPIVGNYETVKGFFATPEEAWQWVEDNNDPLMDYDVFEIDDDDDMGAG